MEHSLPACCFTHLRWHLWKSQLRCEFERKGAYNYVHSLLHRFYQNSRHTLMDSCSKCLFQGWDKCVYLGCGGIGSSSVPCVVDFKICGGCGQWLGMWLWLTPSFNYITALCQIQTWMSILTDLMVVRQYCFCVQMEKVQSKWNAALVFFLFHLWQKRIFWWYCLLSLT